MIVFVLCGGMGSRLSDYSFPKPLNMIHGKPSIAYCLQYLPPEITTIHFIVAPHLQKYNFAEVVTNLFKTRTCVFHNIPYFTRGPVESAWLGVRDLVDTSENVVFLDNDVLYKFPNALFEQHSSAFLGYAIDKTNSEAYSFLTLQNDMVTAYKEKQRISSNFCCGVYGFKDLAQFRNYAWDTLQQMRGGELYMSLLFQKMLEQGDVIRGIQFEGDIYHIGSLKELQMSWNQIPLEPMRICFDLDNTLVTYPSMPGDYSTVRPITDMITLAQEMKRAGHIIIIYTARRMTTHGHNIGATIRDIGRITFDTLEKFEIPYDELIFGKPIADIYIDDRAVNPYRNTTALMGYIGHVDKQTPLNALPPNKYNTIQIVDNKICKTGPHQYTSGEIFYYENIPHDSALATFFPKYYGSIKASQSQLFIEQLKGIPLYTLYKAQMVTENHIMHLFEVLDVLHNTTSPLPLPLITDIISNYSEKLRRRFANKADYPFADAEAIQEACLSRLVYYVPTAVGYIHGDLWFSNIIVDFQNNIKLFDMKGQVNGVYTTGGDPMYDYGKLFQSILGYDAVLYNDSVDMTYQKHIYDVFMCELYKRNISETRLRDITFSLVLGTLHFIHDSTTKERVWTWIKRTFYEV
jgi:capsule biosynthesis phosphatase